MVVKNLAYIPASGRFYTQRINEATLFNKSTMCSKEKNTAYKSDDRCSNTIKVLETLVYLLQNSTRCIPSMKTAVSGKKLI